MSVTHSLTHSTTSTSHCLTAAPAQALSGLRGTGRSSPGLPASTSAWAPRAARSGPVALGTALRGPRGFPCSAPSAQVGALCAPDRFLPRDAGTLFPVARMPFPLQALPRWRRSGPFTDPPAGRQDRRTPARAASLPGGRPWGPSQAAPCAPALPGPQHLEQGGRHSRYLW